MPDHLVGPKVGGACLPPPEEEQDLRSGSVPEEGKEGGGGGRPRDEPQLMGQDLPCTSEPVSLTRDRVQIWEVKTGK